MVRWEWEEGGGLKTLTEIHAFLLLLLLLILLMLSCSLGFCFVPWLVALYKRKFIVRY